METLKIDQIYSSHRGEDMLTSKPQIWNDIKQSLLNSKLQFHRGESQHIKTEVSNTLTKLGWADSVRIEPTKLTINFVKGRVGLCLQLGNVARTYADLLKLQLMHERNVIDVGVIVVPLRSESKKLGSNHAQYERLMDEVKLFENIIIAPLIVIGLST